MHSHMHRYAVKYLFTTAFSPSVHWHETFAGTALLMTVVECESKCQLFVKILAV